MYLQALIIGDLRDQSNVAVKYSLFALSFSTATVNVHMQKTCFQARLLHTHIRHTCHSLQRPQTSGKSLLSTSMRIQRMRLRLQWYDLTVKYRTGKDMELPDTLSWAQLLECTPEIDGLKCLSQQPKIHWTEEAHARGAKLSPTDNSKWLALMQTRCTLACTAILGLKTSACFV